MFIENLLNLDFMPRKLFSRQKKRSCIFEENALKSELFVSKVVGPEKEG